MDTLLFDVSGKICDVPNKSSNARSVTSEYCGTWILLATMLDTGQPLTARTFIFEECQFIEVTESI